MRPVTLPPATRKNFPHANESLAAGGARQRRNYQQQGPRSHYKQQGQEARSKKQETRSKKQEARKQQEEQENEEDEEEEDPSFTSSRFRK